MSAKLKWLSGVKAELKMSPDEQIEFDQYLIGALIYRVGIFKFYRAVNNAVTLIKERRVSKSIIDGGHDEKN